MFHTLSDFFCHFLGKHVRNVIDDDVFELIKWCQVLSNNP